MSRRESDNNNTGQSGRLDTLVALAVICILLGLVLAKCAGAADRETDNESVAEAAVTQVSLLGDITGPMVTIVAINGDTSLTDGVTVHPSEEGLSLSVLCFDDDRQPTWDVSEVLVQALMPGVPGWITVAYTPVVDQNSDSFRRELAGLCWAHLDSRSRVSRHDVRLLTVPIDIANLEQQGIHLDPGAYRLRGWAVDQDGYLLAPPGFLDFLPESHDASAPQVVITMR